MKLVTFFWNIFIHLYTIGKVLLYLTKQTTKLIRKDEEGHSIFIVLLSFVPIWHKLKLFWRRETQLSKFSHQIGLWTRLWYIFLNWWFIWESQAQCQQYTFWDVSIENYKKVVWASHKKQTNEYQSSVASPSILVSRFLSQVFALNFLSDELLSRRVIWNKPFPSQITSIHSVLSWQ